MSRVHAGWPSGRLTSRNSRRQESFNDSRNSPDRGFDGSTTENRRFLLKNPLLRWAGRRAPSRSAASDDGALLDGDEEPVAVLAPNEPQQLLERVGRTRDRSRAPPEGEHRLALLGAARPNRDRPGGLLALDHHAGSVSLTCCAHAVIFATCPG